VLDRLGDFALRISRREYCQEQKIVMISLHRPSVLPGKFHEDGLLITGGQHRGQRFMRAPLNGANFARNCGQVFPAATLT